MGTVNYLSPEQIRGERADAASDQFSLAVVGYECITGSLPYNGDSIPAVMYAIMSLEPERPTGVRPGIDPVWDEVLARGLAKDAALRFASVGQFAAALAGGSGEPAATAPAPASAPTGALPSVAPARTVEAPSLAVLYFENLSSDRETDYFGAGITEDILTDLSKVPGLRVVTRNAVARYRGQTVDVRQVGEELGVGAVLEGSVRKAGNRVRINAQLVDARTGFHLWGDRYDRMLEDVFAVQEDIAQAIATALRGALSPTEAAAIRRARPAEAEAYDLYLKGRDFYARYTPDDNYRALKCFEDAAGIDPQYALAWAGVADCCAQMLDKGWDTGSDWEERGFRAARRAVELDSRLAEGHKAEALIWSIRRDQTRSVEALHRALHANPRFLPALLNLAHELLSAGDFAGAERCLRRAVEVDPAYAFGHVMLAVLCLYTRRYAEVSEHCHRAQNVGMSPFYATYAYVLRAHAFAEMDDFPAARNEVQGGRAANVPAPILQATEALVAARSGDLESASRRVEALIAEPPSESYGCEVAAGAAARLGRADVVSTFLRAAEQIDPRHWASWRINPDLALVRATPEFAACVGERGLEMVWPQEAPPLPSEDRAQFRRYEEASGMPRGSVIP